MQKRINQLEQKLKELGQQQFLDSLEQLPKPIPPKQKQKNKLDRIFTDPQYIHIAFKLSYNGINYQGLECQQENQSTIEYHLFKAFEKLTFIQSRQDCQYSRAGRTDKGVSALGNVISLKIRKIDNLNETEAERINRLLPPEICLIDQKLVSPDFSARYNCIQRVYKYFFFKSNYNVQTMTEAAQSFLGEHDFRNFCKADVIANQHFIRTIYEISIDKYEDPFQLNKSKIFQQDDRLDLYCITIKGNAFLWHQIRCMVQVLFMIGKGQEDKSVISKLFEIDENLGKPQYDLAPDYQLVLYDCIYKEDELHFVNDSQGLKMNIYARLKDKLTQDYMNYLIFSLIGSNSIGDNAKKVQEEQIEKEKQKKQKVIPIMKMQRGDCIHKQIQNLKGKRKEMYDQKMQKVKDYQKKMNIDS